jgi:diguanylate cyclase (GGDEF)-like protein/PAS domain S-box-containing protein
VVTHAIALERDEAGVADLIVGTSVDVDLPHQVAARLRDSEERLRLALEAAGLAVWDIELARGLVRLDRAGMARLGFSRTPVELPVRAALRMVDAADRPALLAQLRAHLEGRADHLRSEQRLREPAGPERWIELHGLVTARSAAGRARRMIGVAAEITARKLTELHLESLALEDHLTRLPNRRALDATLERAIAQAARDRGRLGVLLLDLDGFKAINDRLGHLAGDELLVEAARRLRKGVRRSDVVARFGGDEFAVVAQGIRTRRQLEQLARRLIAVTAAPVTLAAGPARIRLSIGIAVFPEDGLEPVTLLARADAALYAAKRAGSGYRFAAEPAAA